VLKNAILSKQTSMLP